MDDFLILTKAQADILLSKDGIFWTESNNHLKPKLSPDGNWLMSNEVIAGASLNDLKQILKTLGVFKYVGSLPSVGDTCYAGQIYSYTSTDPIRYPSPFIKCVQTHVRTNFAPETTPALFSFYRENATNLPWIENEYVYVGWRRIYNGVIYEVIQEHLTLSTWLPTATVGVLWRVIVTTTAWTIGVAYKVNDIVTYNNNTYKCLQAHTSQAGWTPSAVPSLWQLQ